MLLLFFLLMCSCGSTITDEKQQHETITEQEHRPIYINCSVPQKLITPIYIPIYDLPLQLLNMKWPSKCKAQLM